METDKYTKIDKSRACLIMGAIGDALGAPVEFMKQEEIIAKYGDTPHEIKGIQYFAEAYGKVGAITDDTQMTLFAADGLISAYKRGAERGILGEYWTYTADSYVKWVNTQGESHANVHYEDSGRDIELVALVKTQGQRGPGNTCLDSLTFMPNPPKPAQNDSKGSGTVMRVAPIGIFFGNRCSDTEKSNLHNVYYEGVKDAAITHGHPTAQHASGLLAVIIALCLNGQYLPRAIDLALEYFGTDDLVSICKKAIELSNESPSVKNLQLLGEGWIAEEALAIALYCSLLCFKNALSVEDSLRLAVNHDGDSDTTGSISGNLIGISLGMDKIPKAMIAAGSEVNSLMELLRKYGEDLIEIIDYKSSSYDIGITMNHMKMDEAKRLAASILQVDQKTLKSRPLDNGQGHYVYQPIRGGAPIIIANDGTYLLASTGISFEDHLAAFLRGERSSPIGIKNTTIK